MESGGVEDIHNLWPEPYTSPRWNAHVKDALEERLHEMVCGGELDLSTAQRDIATDWIAAYKKYSHTDRPLALHSRLESQARCRTSSSREDPPCVFENRQYVFAFDIFQSLEPFTGVHRCDGIQGGDTSDT
jgi:hypothetical protein